MKTAQDYPITFGYLKKTTIDGKPYTHRGNDRPTPTGTPVVISGTVIGTTGATGKAIGAHLHTQAGTDPAVQNTIDPTPHEFRPGQVTAIRPVDTGEWGKFVTIKTGNIYVTYAHLDTVNVHIGQEVGEMAKPNINTLRIAHSEIGGWDFEKTHKGDYDQLFKDAAGHLEVNDFIYKQWVAGGKFREARERAFREVKNLERIVGTLESTNTELQKAIGIKDKEIERLTARLAAKGDDKEVSVSAALKVLVQAIKDAWFNK